MNVPKQAPSTLFVAPVVAFGVVAWVIVTGASLQPLNVTSWWYVLLLSMLIPVARRYHVKLSRHVTIMLTTPPFLLLVLLLPLPDATLAATVAYLGGEVLERSKSGLVYRDAVKGLDLRDLLSLTAMMFLAVVAAGIAAYWSDRLPWPYPVDRAVAVLLAGSAFIAVNLLGIALWATRREGKSPVLLLVRFARDSGLHEVAQVLLAGVGVALAAISPVMLLLLPALTVPVYLYLKHDLETRTSTRAMVIAMADAVDQRDPSTAEHSRRVAAFVNAMARKRGMGHFEIDLVTTAARVHDIGKQDLPAEVLFKPGSLTAEEWAIMETHAALGAQLLSGFRDFRRGVAIVRHHHERWDGKGYPDGLAGFDIPEGARMIAVADSYDAMVSNRPYRAGLPVAVAIAELQKGRESQWEGRLIDSFLEVLQEMQSRESAPSKDAARQGDALARAM